MSTTSLFLAVVGSLAGPSEAADRQERVAVPGGDVAVWVAGRGAKTPAIVVHGGPGFPHDYLQPLAALSDERRVVFYDQLGCGASDRPQDDALWVLDRFVEELSRVQQATVGLRRPVALVGHSWGAMLALEYALRFPDRVSALVLDSPIVSAERFSRDVQVLFEDLPPNVRSTLTAHEAAGTTTSEEYNTAYGEFIARHLFRGAEIPEPLARAMQGKNEHIYNVMWGPSEFSFTGNLNGFERLDRLGEIRVPVLYVVGEHDEVVPAAARDFHAVTRGSELVEIPGASHLKVLEQPEAYVSAVRAFLAAHEAP